MEDFFKGTLGKTAIKPHDEMTVPELISNMEHNIKVKEEGA